MFGTGKKTINSSMTTIYLFLLILIINQFLIVQSFRLSSSDLDQSEPDDARRAVIRQLALNNLANSDESSDDNDYQLVIKPTVQRRFCCMSPLSGRKRSIRALARKQVEKRTV